MVDKKPHQGISFRKQFSSLFLPPALVGAIVFVAIAATGVIHEKELIKAREFATIHVCLDAITHEFQSVRSDLSVLSNSPSLSQFLTSHDKNSFAILEQYFSNLCRHRKLYDQVRYLDENGTEIIRVSFNQGNPRAIPGNRLQNKKHYQYFDNVFKLNADFFPEAWKKISQNENGHLETARGIFSFTTVYPLHPNDISCPGGSQPFSPGNKIVYGKGYAWKLVSFIDRQKLDSVLQKHSWFGIALYLLFIFFLFPACFYFTRLRLHSIETENARRETERLYKNLFERAGDSIFIADPATGRIIDCNTNAAVRLGYSRRELLTKKIYEINPELQQSKIDERLKKQLRGEGISFETTHIHKDGHEIPMEISSTMIEYHGAKIVLALGRDIGERKKARRTQELDRIRQKRLLSLYEKEKLPASYFIDQAIESIGDITSSPDVFFGLLNDDGSILSIHAWSDQSLGKCPMSTKDIQVQVAETALLKEAIGRKGPVIVNDYQHRDLEKHGTLDGHVEINRFMAVPVIENNKIVAMAAVANKKTPYDDTDQNQMELFLYSMWTILQRRKAKESIKIPKQQWEQTFDAVPDLIAIIDTEFRVLRANRAVSKKFNIAIDQCTGMRCYNLFHDVDHPCMECPLLESVATGRSCGFEIYVEKLAATFYTTASPLHDKNGKIVGIVHVARDISERIKREQAIKQSEAFLQAIIDGVVEPIMVIDTDHTIKLCNKAALASLNPEDQHNAELKCHSISHGSDTPCHTDGHPCPLKQVIETGQPCTCVHEHLVEDEKRFMEIIAAPYIAPDGSLQGIIESLRDITERELAEQKIKNYAEMQTILLREINHRVKNSLTAILSILHKEEDRTTADERHSRLPLLHNLEDRIYGLLAVGKMLSTSGWQPLLLSELCYTIVAATMQNRPPAAQIEINIPASPVRVDSNQAHNLAIIFNELATNTLKHGLPAADPARITVKTISDKSWVTIVFKDNGPGYPAAMLLDGGLDSTSMGIELIKGIVAQTLRGTLAISNDNGAVMTITFDLDSSKTSAEN
jgi:PAS domain S-box-containing protein